MRVASVGRQADAWSARAGAGWNESFLIGTGPGGRASTRGREWRVGLMGRFRSGVAVVVGVVLVAGCGAGTEGGTGSIVVDSCGREVAFDSPPERVLAIGS